MNDNTEHEEIETRSDAIGFFDERGKWITMTELEKHWGDKVDASVREIVDSLEEADMLNVRRDEDGEPVTSQLTQFAVDLHELPEDAPPGQTLGVYAKHDKEPPNKLKEQWLEEFRQKKRSNGGN